MLSDLRHGLRMLIKNPGFTVIAILSIAIGVGANAAMFSVADGLVIRPLPVPRAGEVMSISAVLQEGGRNSALSHPEYRDLRDRTRSFNGVVAYQLVVTTFITRPDEPAQRRAGMARGVPSGAPRGPHRSAPGAEDRLGVRVQSERPIIVGIPHPHLSQRRRE